VRVENARGAVWMVDEEEYQRRKSQRISGYGGPLPVHHRSGIRHPNAFLLKQK